MEVSSKAADRVFEKEFARGVVLITEMRFPSGTRRLKYIVVLNDNPADSTTLLFLTTSQTDYYDRFPHVDHIRIKANTLPFFPKDTILDCREVFAMEREDLKRRYREAALRVEGVFPQEYMDQIDKIVAVSRTIAIRYKKQVLGWV